jgi:hypothetical protein
VFDRLPDGVEFVPDVSAADWFIANLEPWVLGEGVRLASFMPEGFEAYVRVFHPFRDRDRSGSPTPWSEVAAAAGMTLGPGTRERDIDDLSDEDRLPMEGSIPEEICGALVEILAEKTETPDLCWFAQWSGWGTYTEEEYAAPQIHEPHRHTGRSYLLFRGPIGAACSWEFGPSYWWSDDRAWAVVTEIDGPSTYVGGGRETVEEILGRQGLETVEVDRDVKMG